MEQRRHDRLIKEIKVSYSVLSKVDSTPFEFGEAVTVDIGSGGLSILVDERLGVPSLLQLHLHLPRRPLGLFALGKTVYCNPVEDLGMFRAGIKFVGLLPTDLEKALNEIEEG